MQKPLQTTRIADGVNFHAMEDDKFRVAKIAVNFIVPMDEQSAADYAIVPFLLRKGHKGLPDFTALCEKLAMLYGATLSADVSRIGGNQVIEISITALDNRFTLGGEDVAGETARLLCDLISAPNVENGEFPAADTASEKRFLIENIEAEINDKRAYSVNRAYEIMCKGTELAIGRYGKTEQVEKITGASAFCAYEKLMKSAEIAVIFVGSGDSAAVCEVFKTALGNLPREFSPRTNRSYGAYSGAEVKETTERLELSQAKLVLGFKTGESASLKEHSAKVLFSLVYGGTPFSKLFMNVREKLSLCYYCQCGYDRVTDTMIVSSGVEESNVERAKAEILAQLEKTKNGEITESELQSAKLSVQNALKIAGDTLQSIGSRFLRNIVWGKDSTIEQELQMLMSLTAEDVAAAARTARLDTCYLLAGKGVKSDESL